MKMAGSAEQRVVGVLTGTREADPGRDAGGDRAGRHVLDDDGVRADLRRRRR